MIKQTTDYDKFKFRDDNRAALCQKHIKRLKDSISMRNLLEHQPITVNASFEVLDGQHRLMAARDLNVPIFYKLTEELTSADIIALNVSKSWQSVDYLNYYVKNGYDEYIKLKNFMESAQIPIKVAITLTMPNTFKCYNEFKQGNYQFIDENLQVTLDICRSTMDYIRRMNGGSSFLTSSKLWRCLVKLVQHADFNLNQWQKNVAKFTHKFTAKATSGDYDRLLMEVHNYRSTSKVDLLNEQY